MIGSDNSDSVEGNVIAGNGSHGILVTGALATDNLIAENYIGTNPAGTIIFPNPNGLRLIASSSTRVRRNVILGNSSRGIVLDTNATFLNTGTPSSDNCVVQNAEGVRDLATGAPVPIFENTGGVQRVARVATAPGQATRHSSSTSIHGSARRQSRRSVRPVPQPWRRRSGSRSALRRGR